MLATSPDRTTELAPLDNGLFAPASLLPAVALAAVGLLCYAVSLLVFKQKTIGGWAWVLPFLASGAAGVVLYRRQCLSVGVLTNTESVVLARSMSIWVAVAIVFIYSFTQKSMVDGVIALFLGGMMFATILFTGIFIVKTMLLMQDEPDRERGDDMSVQDIEKMKAEFRLQRGLHEVRDPQTPATARSVASSAPNASAIAELPRSIYTPASAPEFVTESVAESSPVRLSTQVSKPVPLAAVPPASAARPAPATQPLPAAQPRPAVSDEEIRLKIIEVRKQALRAQRRAQLQAKGTGPRH
jgi:hypothetical protein